MTNEHDRVEAGEAIARSARPEISPVKPRSGSAAATYPLVEAPEIFGGFWSTRQTINGQVSLEHARRQLEAAGAFENFRRVARKVGGKHQGEINQDAEVYKWLEACSYELARADDPTIRELVSEVIDVVVAAQDHDGYLHTWHQLDGRRSAFGAGLHTGGADETYAAGHLMHAAVAACRAAVDTRLVTTAERLSDCIRRSYADRGPDSVPGHPGIEMGLVELYRLTGQRRHLDLATLFIDRRGHASLGGHRFGSSHYLDYAPLRDLTTLTGHAVAALYLASGATDVAMETMDGELLSALERQWLAVQHARTYLTGGLGSRHRNEDLGADFELPSDRAYAETCAAIASVMWSWRLLLATGHPRYADAIERAVLNGVLAGVSLSGDSFFYSNPLQVRAGHRPPADEASFQRCSWFETACCPPNLMRLFASLGHYVASEAEGALWIHQYASCRIGWPGQGSGQLTVQTDYPWEGTVDIRFAGRMLPGRTLWLRVPAWAPHASVTVSGMEEGEIDAAPGSYVPITRDWRDGDRCVLRVDMAPRLTTAHPSVDAVRGSVAIERGPLVYCVEQVDHEASLDELRIDPESPMLAGPWSTELGVVPIGAQALRIAHPEWADQLYRTLATRDGGGCREGRTQLRAIPYFAWGNRATGPMRVWIPLGPEAKPDQAEASTSASSLGAASASHD